MKKIFFLCVVCSALFFSCRSDIDGFEVGSPESENKVLFAGVSSNFKNAVLERVVRELGTGPYYCKGVGVSRLQELDWTPFKVVVIVSLVQGGEIEEWARLYYSRDKTKGRVIGFYTVGFGINEDGMPNMGTPEVNIDAVSSASKMDMVEQKAKELSELIKKKCEGV